MAELLSSDITLEQIDSFFNITANLRPQGQAQNQVNSVPRSSTKHDQPGSNLKHSDARLNRPLQRPAEFIPPYKRKTNRSADSETYAYYYKKLEEEELKNPKSSIPLPDDDSAAALSDIAKMEALEYSSVGDPSCMHNDVMEETNHALYSNYNMNPQYNQDLPITKCREEILSLIESNQVTVIEGPTGSGKTTQVPQYILDHYAAQGKYCNIVVTQPRRIAAMSIARRVCAERNWQLTGICGYQIGMDRQASEDTRLIFMTTQVLLRKLITAKSMQNYTHVILDEVHERDQYSDFCLLVVRKLLRTTSRNVKVILMSATIEANLFANYLKIPVRNEMQPAPILTVEGGTFKVAEYFIEDLEQLGEIPELLVDRPSISIPSFELAKRLILEFDNLEKKRQGESPTGFAAKRGSVLVFLPGLSEIATFDDILDRYKEKHRLRVLPLHSSITGDEQVRVFDPPNPPERKVILATNIAESSITVTDIKYVIDFCLTKNLQCDNETYTSLQLEWASKANCTQRKGRAGRVSNGRVYRMVTRDFWDEYLPEYGTPEMRRCPLENLVLQTKLFNIGEPKAILGLALSPPNLDDIERTILVLKEVGALRTTVGPEYNPHDGDLTFMGRVLAELPVDIHIGKLIMLGYSFGMLEDCIIIGAMLSLKSIFATPFKAKLEAYKTKLAWAGGSKSDCIAMLNAYKLWEQKTNSGFFSTRRQEVIWTKTNMVQLRRLHDVKELVRELSLRLRNFNIVGPRGPRIHGDHNEEALILKVIISGAFYPNYFFRVLGDEEQANRTLSGHNPFTTVMIWGLPTHQGGLYREAIQELFRPCAEKCRIYFEDTRAYIEFDKSTRLGGKEYSPAVYLALKMNQLRIPMFLNLLDEDEAYRRMQILKATGLQDRNFSRSSRISQMGGMVGSLSNNQVDLPNHSTSIIELEITEIVECGRFWALYGDEETAALILEQQSEINNGQNLSPLSEAPVIGMFCLALYDMDGLYYRARVEHIDRTSKTAVVEIFFVDYGNVSRVREGQLRELKPNLRKLKFQAFECQLASIKPSSVRCPGGRWTEQATEDMNVLVSRSRKAYGKVYSVVHGVVRMELQLDMNGRKVDVKKYLIEKGFADHAEESFLSKQDHADREDEQKAARLSNIPRRNEEVLTEQFAYMSTSESVGKPIGMRPARKYGTSANRICLHGPSSPYEVGFVAATAIGSMKAVKVERDSVNSIVLDETPEDSHMQIMVAANVAVNPAGDTIMARDTTVLPNIPGLPALLSLLFTPQAELRVDSSQSRYTGALCGLGWDRFTDGPALPDHDIELAFDTYIDNQDISLVNSVRLAINIAIGNGDNIAEWGQDGMLKVQGRARKRLLELLNQRRDNVEPDYSRCTHLWNQMNPDEILLNESPDEESFLLSMHPVVALMSTDANSDIVSAKYPVSKEEKEKLKMRDHIQWLRGKSTSENFGSGPVECILCHFKMHSFYELKIHLAGRMHLEQETRYLI